ncbi:hypothetical protein DKX38_003165 [Salix brachista]|uniref:Uncharacterized protein n=1 Tax=Salix brachista TaxID=2182728 RepID=A0A5N5NQ12_9ROSI|nr:hypothetical protein DKX38_003165 [Salix brachista]
MINLAGHCDPYSNGCTVLSSEIKSFKQKVSRSCFLLEEPLLRSTAYWKQQGDGYAATYSSVIEQVVAVMLASIPTLRDMLLRTAQAPTRQISLAFLLSLILTILLGSEADG